MNVRQLAFAAIAALAVGGTALAQGVPGPAATPPPPPAPNGNVATPGTLLGRPSPAASPTPAASATAAARKGRRAGAPEPAASPTETPEPPQFATMDGVWEVQLQPLDGRGRTTYSHFSLSQKGEALTGLWIRSDKEKVPLTGTFDGRLYKLSAKGTVQTWTLSGYAENFSDMVGMVVSADPKDKGIPFTASHRKKEKISK